MNILKKYTKSGVVTTGSDNVQLDSPEFEIVNVIVDTVAQTLQVEVMHEVAQGSLTQKHSRTFELDFTALPSDVKQTGKAFFDAIEQEMLSLSQYTGATEV